MMKKLLVLLMVLGIASQANAMLQISVNGDLDPVDSEYTLNPSEELILDIWTNAAIANLTGTYFILVADTQLSTIDNLSGVAVYPSQAAPDSGLMLMTGMNAVADLLWGVGYVPVGADGLGGAAFDMDDAAATPAGAILFDLIMFHCQGFGDVTLQIWESPDAAANWTLSDSVRIHQIPEPMTMALLGLGGLFLRRRSK
jgi:hypothetical protein